MQQQQLAQEQLAMQQQQMQNERFQLHQHQLIQPIQTQPHIHQIHYTYSRRTSLDSNALDVRYLFFIALPKIFLIDFPYFAVRAWTCFFNCVSLQTNQLTDIICRAVQPSIQSASNTLTRNSSLRDTGDYAIPQPHPHHHIITTKSSNTSLIRCGSCPGSTGVSRRGSSSESSPAGTVGNTSVIGGSDGTRDYQGYYTDTTAHYDRMPMPIPISVPIAPLHMGSMHSEDEIEPAYATVFPNTTANMPQIPQQQINYQTEDRSIYRRGARRWRKLYRINGHIFQAKRFNRVSKRHSITDFTFPEKREARKLWKNDSEIQWVGGEVAGKLFECERWTFPLERLTLAPRLVNDSWRKFPLYLRYLASRLSKWRIIEL